MSGLHLRRWTSLDCPWIDSEELVQHHFQPHQHSQQHHYPPHQRCLHYAHPAAFERFPHTTFWSVNSDFKPITFINLLTGNLWRTLVYRQFIILEFHQKAQFIALRLFFVNFFFESPSKYLGTERLGGIFTGKNIQKFFLFLSLYYTVKISLIASNN